MPVIMGRKTYEAINLPLPGRINIVITKTPGWSADNVLVANDITNALNKAEETNCKEMFIIGGGEVYKQTIDRADRIYMTRVHALLEGDTWFPEIKPDQWEIRSETHFPADEKHNYSFSIQKWERKRNNTVPH